MKEEWETAMRRLAARQERLEEERIVTYKAREASARLSGSKRPANENLARMQKARFDNGDITVADGPLVGDVITLLSSAKFLVSGLGHEVPISYLEGKVVGLYFYHYWTSTRVFFELKHMYEKLRDKGENFELVFVCIHEECHFEELKAEILRSREQMVENKFEKYFQGKTWLALPFSQRKSNRELYDWSGNLTLDEYLQSELVIIRPGENIAHPYAMSIFLEYGMEAYPFSKSRVTEIEVARLKSLTLDDVLFSGADEKFVYDQDGQKISASHLVGKNILLFLTPQPPKDSHHRRQDKRIYKKVIKWYNALKQGDEAFEMIRVFYWYNQIPDQTLGEASKRKRPWLEFPYNKYNMGALYSKLLKAVGDKDLYIPMFVAFGRDGQFITMKSFYRCGKSKIGDYDCQEFFDDSHLYAQVRDYIASDKEWSSVDEETQSFYYHS